MQGIETVGCSFVLGLGMLFHCLLWRHIVLTDVNITNIVEYWERSRFEIPVQHYLLSHLCPDIKILIKYAEEGWCGGLVD